jgi:hypothetical protein
MSDTVEKGKLSMLVEKRSVRCFNCIITQQRLLMCDDLNLEILYIFARI